MKQCNKCGKTLINAGTFYLHPTTNECTEEDGTRLEIIDQFLFDKFQEEHGKPIPIEEIIQLKDIRMQNLESVIQQQEEIIFNNQFKQRLFRILRKIMFWKYFTLTKKKS